MIHSKSTVLVWLRKYGTLDWSQPNLNILTKSKETLAQKIKRLEEELSDEQLKNKLLYTIVDIADEQFSSSI